MRLLALLLLCLPGLAAAQSWTPINQTGSPLALRGASYCYAGKFSGTQCVVIGCTPQRALGLYLISPTLAKNGMRSAQLSVDSRVLRTIDFTQHDGALDMFVYDLTPDSAKSILHHLRAGAAFRFDFQTGSDAFAISGSLNGSIQATSYAESACPAPSVAPLADPEAQARAELAGECASMGGLAPIASPMARSVDLDGVPPMDLALSYDNVRCNDMVTGMYCGSAGCRQVLFQGIPGGYRSVFDGNLHSFQTGPAGTVTMAAHGGACNRVGAAGCTMTFRFINGEFTLIDKR